MQQKHDVKENIIEERSLESGDVSVNIWQNVVGYMHNKDTKQVAHFHGLISMY